MDSSMMEKISVRTLAFAAAMLPLGCSSHKPAHSGGIDRAPGDLACPEAEIAYTRFDETTLEAKGCGAQITYVVVCDSRFSAAKSATMGMPMTTEHCDWEPLR